MSQEDDDKTRTHVVLAKGTMVFHYRIVEKIGAGGMGEVFLAEDTQLDRKVALKFLPPHLCQDEDCRARFKREAQAAAKLDHPNIVTVYEVGDFKGRPFFAMQHLEGRSLKEVIETEALDIDRIIGIAIQLCDGLKKAHEAGVTHRDIKPSNIVIDSNGRPRLLDFGLATVKGGEHLTKTGSTLGTIGYMSPEQISGKETDARSDLFSLGVVLYELIASRAPFRKDDEAATLNAILHDTPEPLARFKTGVPEDLQRIITNLLEKNPELRYQSAAGVIPDLKKLAPGITSVHVVPKKSDWWNRYIVPSAVVVILAVLGYWYFGVRDQGAGSSNPDDRIMLAVLPFENLGDPDDEYFADGITDEITTNLAGLSGLGVISRTSAMRYKDSEKSLRQIGKELGVDCIVVGTIRWDKSGGENRVRINPQLIAVDNDMNLWADMYDAVLTDIFEVQSGIASEVAAALDITLLQSEQAALARDQEMDPLAYDFYLRGKKYYSFQRSYNQDYVLAERMFERAIELQPDFAQAYAELSSLYTDLFWSNIDPTLSRLDTALAVLLIATALAPDLPETHMAAGWYYYHGRRMYDSALVAFEQVLRLQPNNALAVASIAWVKRRQGDFDSALQDMYKAVKLDPWNPWYQYELGVTLAESRRFEEAIAPFDRAIEMQPEQVWAYLMKSLAVFSHTGDYEQTRAVIDAAYASCGQQPQIKHVDVLYNLAFEKYDRALSVLADCKPEDIYLFPGEIRVDYYYLKGMVLQSSGNSETAKPFLDTARTELEDMIKTAPDVADYHNSLARVYVYLGMNEEAVRSAKRAVDLLPIDVDALSGPEHLTTLAIVYAQTGELDSAMDVIEHLFEIPTDLSVNMLKLSSDYRPLRGYPRFEALLEKYNSGY